MLFLPIFKTKCFKQNTPRILKEVDSNARAYTVFLYNNELTLITKVFYSVEHNFASMLESFNILLYTHYLNK